MSYSPNGATDIRLPDHSFDYPGGPGWLMSWEVEWSGGRLNMPHSLLGLRTLEMEIKLRAGVIDSVSAHEGAAATVIDIGHAANGVWNDQAGDSGNANGSVVTAGHYSLVVYLPGETERALLSPVLPDGMLFAPPDSAGGSQLAWITDNGSRRALAAGSEEGSAVTLTDAAALAGSGNGIYWQVGAVDGDNTQGFVVTSGDNGAHGLEFRGDGVLKIDGVDVLAAIRARLDALETP
jgi:hypothetical protein